jgi:hypothetical protein
LSAYAMWGWRKFRPKAVAKIEHKEPQGDAPE